MNNIEAYLRRFTCYCGNSFAVYICSWKITNMQYSGHIYLHLAYLRQWEVKNEKAFGGLVDVYLEYVLVELFSIPMKGKSPDFTMCLTKRYKWTTLFFSVKFVGSHRNQEALRITTLLIRLSTFNISITHCCSFSVLAWFRIMWDNT